MQVRLVPFECQYIVGLLLPQSMGNLFLSAHSRYRSRSIVTIQPCQQARDGCACVGLFHGHLAQGQALRPGPGAHLVQGRHRMVQILGAAAGLAVYGRVLRRSWRR